MAHSVSADGFPGDGTSSGGTSSGGHMPDGGFAQGDFTRGLAPGAQRFRIWIASYVDWRPASWNQVPPRATAVEPVEQALCTAEEAALFLQGFNSSMLAHHEPIWAVAVPITLCYEGDAVPGLPVRGYAFPLEEPTFPLEDPTRQLTSKG